MGLIEYNMQMRSEIVSSHYRKFCIQTNIISESRTQPKRRLKKVLNSVFDGGFHRGNNSPTSTPPKVSRSYFNFSVCKVNYFGHLIFARSIYFQIL